MTLSTGRSRPRSPIGTKRGRRLGHLDPREPLLARLRIAYEEAEREREARDVRKRLPGPDGERRKHGIELPVEQVGKCRELLLRAVRGRPHEDSVLGERGA